MPGIEQTDAKHTVCAYESESQMTRENERKLWDFAVRARKIYGLHTKFKTSLAIKKGGEEEGKRDRERERQFSFDSNVNSFP